MRLILSFILSFFTIISFSQWSDNFTDGDFTANPIWSGQVSNFDIDVSNRLHLNAPAVSDTSYLSVLSDVIENATWEFLVDFDFNPSSSNLARVYLTSNQANLKGSLNGYFVKIGNTNDEVSLYRQDGLVTTQIIDGVDGTVSGSTNSVRVKVTRDVNGNWELLIDNTGGTTYLSQGTVQDNTYFSSIYAGVHCKYTSTRSTKFHFDDFVVTGSPYVDNSPPFVMSVTATSINSADVLFSEDMNQASVENISNYSLDNSIGSPSSAVLDASNLALVHLTFGTNFTNNTSYFLTTTNVSDLAGNVLTNSVDNFTYFVPDVAIGFDVLITEFMADYAPSQGLPEIEYVEIYNNSNKSFDVNNWTISDASTTVVLGSYILLPGQYLILADGTSSTFGQFNILQTQLPSLNNSGDDIVLKNDLGTTIDSISYDLSWYHDSNKDGGGWSIERKRLSAQCSDANNWCASESSIGGTPGNQNSIFTTQVDTSAPIVLDYSILNDTLTLIFDENVDGTNLTIDITPNLNVVSWQNNSANQIIVVLSSLQDNTVYEATLNNITNCWGTSISNYKIIFGKPTAVEKGDVVINEIMFNPLTNGSDYVEIVNVSDKVLDLNGWMLANIDNDTLDNLKPIITQQHLFLPGDYILITKDSTDIIHDFTIYGIGTFINTDLPTYPNDSGSVILINNNNQILDFVHYDESYHFELLSTTDGKALERISFTGASDNPDNWHTASEQVEWGTPGYLNSQYIDNVVSGEVSLNTKIFSPDNDGYQDVVILNYEFTNPDNVMDVEIFDSEGRMIRKLKDGYYPGTKGFVTWDGINDDGTKAQTGTFILLVTVFDLEGNKTNYKKVVVLASKL
jgi:hypothetical protein